MLISVIVNPVSGGASRDTVRRRCEQAQAVLASRGVHGDVIVSERKGHARELAARAVERGSDLVIAWGGDGTVNEVGSALAFGDTPLGIVPSGSGNGLARELGIARRPERAIVEALDAAPRRIDAGELAGRLFFNAAGLGFDAHVSACFDRDPSRSRGFATYARITVRELLAYRSARYEIDGQGSCRAMLVTFANSTQFGNGARIAPQARLDDGRLDLVVFEEISRWRTICALPRLFTGGVTRVRGVTFRQIERATVQSDQPIIFHVDGEPVLGGTRLEARVRPSALRISVR